MMTGAAAAGSVLGRAASSQVFAGESVSGELFVFMVFTVVKNGTHDDTKYSLKWQAVVEEIELICYQFQMFLGSQ